MSIKIADLYTLWEEQKGRCAITGVELNTISEDPFSASVDRIDSKLGYTKENIQLVSQAINFAKNSGSNQRIIEWVQTVRSLRV